MVYLVYLVQLVLAGAIGNYTYTIIRPSISEMKRLAIAIAVATIFVVGTTTVIDSSGLIPGYEHILKEGE